MRALHQEGDIIAERYRILDTLGQDRVQLYNVALDAKQIQQLLSEP